jgi:hypothetical protein
VISLWSPPSSRSVSTRELSASSGPFEESDWRLPPFTTTQTHKYFLLPPGPHENHTPSSFCHVLPSPAITPSQHTNRQLGFTLKTAAEGTQLCRFSCS